MRAKPMHGALFLLMAWSCCLHLAVGTRTHREHKVHNIVLYPDKHSWCKTTPIKQVVAWPGCVAREIDNNVCVGACFSYTIPQTEPSAPGDVISPYCDSCQPSEVTWLDLTLECTNEEEPVETLAPEPSTTSLPNASLASNFSSPPILKQKRVQVIANCSCSACHGHAHHHHPSPSDPLSGGDGDSPPHASLLDVPELMGLMRQAHDRKLAGNHSSGPHIIPQLPEVADLESEGEEEKVETPHLSLSETLVPSPSLPPEESSALPDHHSETSFNPPSVSHAEPHPHHPHPHHPHIHHPHHHHPHHPPPTTLDVPQEKLHPAQDGAELSYHDNLVPSDESQEKEEEF